MKTCPRGVADPMRAPPPSMRPCTVHAGEKPLSGDQDKDPARERLRELLSGVISLEDTMEVGAVIELLRQVDDVPVHLQPEVLAILHSFRALPRSTQDRLLPILAEALNASDDEK